MSASTSNIADLVERLEKVEKGNRGLRRLLLVSSTLALAALAASIALSLPARPREGPARFTAVEARRFVLRDAEGALRGVMEVDDNGAASLALGENLDRRVRRGNSVALGVGRDMRPVLTLYEASRRATVLLTGEPAVVLTRAGDEVKAGLFVGEDGSSRLLLRDAQGRPVTVPARSSGDRGR